MRETLYKYLDLMERLNNNEFLMSPEERYEMDNFFNSSTELINLRSNLISEENPEQRRVLVEEYLKSIEKDLDKEELAASLNLKSIKDITLQNDKRVVVMFPKGTNEPYVINVDRDDNIIEKLRKKQSEYAKYQGMDSNFNVEQILKDMADEEHSYEQVKPLQGYVIDGRFSRDPEKLRKISFLIKKAVEKNGKLEGDDKFTYIDEDNDYIMTNNGVVLEAKVDSLTNEMVVQSPESASEFKNEEVTNESGGTTSNEESEYNNEAPESNEVKDEDYSDEMIESVYEEVFIKGGITDASVKEDIIKKLKEINKDPKLLESDSLSESQKEWYMAANKRLDELKKQKEYTLTYDKKAGVSSYLYIAIFVLVVAFIVFMYFIFRR